MRIAAGTTSLYPYPEENMGRTNYFETKEVEMSERDELMPVYPSFAGDQKMTNEQVSGLAAPIPAHHFLETGTEPPGYFVGFQYLVVNPVDDRMLDVEFYVAAPHEQ